MINGNANEFIDGLYYGDERFFIYNQKKYFIEGWTENDKLMLILYIIEDPQNKFEWSAVSNNNNYPVDKFETADIFDGKTFWEVEKDIEWVDC